MCLFFCKVSFVLVLSFAFCLKDTHAKGERLHQGYKNFDKFSQIGPNHEGSERTHAKLNNGDVAVPKEANFRRSMKRENVTEEENSALLTRRAEDIFMDEIKGSDQAANRAEIAFDIPKQLEYIKASMKAGDISDIDTDNMIDLNEKKGAYLPVSEVKAHTRNAPKKKLLTEQFKNITGLPDFMLKKPGLQFSKDKSATLVEKVADSLQPGAGALSGIKMLLEESKVEQSLKKHLDKMNANLINSIPNPPVPNVPSIVETSNGEESLNAVNLASEQGLNTAAYITPISSDQLYDESISPPEQLLDELSTGKFKRPLSDNALERMSEWNANKEFLHDNGYASHEPEFASPKLTRVSSEMLPVHDLVLNQQPVKSTEIVSKESLELLKSDPEVLGRNQEILNGKRFHSISDLDSIGPPIYPARVVHLAHRPKHIFMPSKHIVAHFNGGDFHEDENSEDGAYDDGEFTGHLYHPHRPG